METGGAFYHSKIGSHYRGAESRERFPHSSLINLLSPLANYVGTIVKERCATSISETGCASDHVDDHLFHNRPSGLGSVNLVNLKGNHPGQGHNPLTDTLENEASPAAAVAIGHRHYLPSASDENPKGGWSM